MRFAMPVLAGLLFVCTVAVGQDAKKNDQPTEVKELAGKTLDEWIDEIHATDPSKRERAMQMVLGFGQIKAQRAVPAIIKELNKHKPTEPIDLSVRIAGTVALGTILTYVETSEPKETAKVKTPDQKQVAEAVTILKKFCNDEQVVVRTRAVQALARIGPQLLTAQKEVMHVAEDKATWEARHAGLQTLMYLTMMKEKVTDKDKAIFPDPLLSVFYRRIDEKYEKSMQVRSSAASALAQFTLTPGSKEHILLLKNLKRMTVEDPEPSVKIMAHLALMTVKLKTDAGKKEFDPEHLKAITSMLAHKDPAVRVQSAQALAMCGPKAAQNKGVTSSLIAGLKDEDANVVGSCIYALVQLEAKDALPDLEMLAKNPEIKSDAVKQAAVDACDAIRFPNKKMEKQDKTETK